MKTLIAALALLTLTTLPALACRKFSVLSPTVTVKSVAGPVFLEQNGTKITVDMPITLEAGSLLYLPRKSQVSLEFADGSHETVSGEASIEVTPFFPVRDFSPAQALKNFLGRILGFFASASVLARI